MLEAWRISEDYYKRGVFKAIGVSNFTEADLDNLFEKGTVRPGVNQIKSQVNTWNDSLLAYNKENGIETVAWSPLGGIVESAKNILEEIGNKHTHKLCCVITLSGISSLFLSLIIKSVKHRV